MTTKPNQFKTEFNNLFDKLETSSSFFENEESIKFNLKTEKDKDLQQVEFLLKKVFETFLENPSVISNKIKVHVSIKKENDYSESKQFQIRYTFIFNPFYLLTESFLKKTEKQKEIVILDKIKNIIDSYRFKFKVVSYKTLVHAIRYNDQDIESKKSSQTKIYPNKYYYYYEGLITFEYKNN